MFGYFTVILPLEALLGQLGGGLPFGGPMGMPGMPGFRQDTERAAGCLRFEHPSASTACDPR